MAAQLRQPRCDATSSPVCLLSFERDALVAVVECRGRIVERVVMGNARRPRLEELLAEHRTAFETGWSPQPFDLWSSATEKFLSEVYDLISEPLQAVLSGYPRVTVDFGDPVLANLPVETAHRYERPALFELLPIYRDDGVAADGSRRRRSFNLELRRGDTSGLHMVAGEEALVRSSYRTDPVADSEPMVHIVGHDPVVDAAKFRRSERAHIVLSGCDSLPESLPQGVASATATLWPIDDHTNATTISLFHSRVGLGVGPMEALRQAQLLQRCLPPAVWAAYVHLGQPD